REPETRRSRRQIALAHSALEAPRRHQTRQLEQRLVVGAVWKDLELVFCSHRGTPLFSRNVVRAFNGLLETADRANLRLHDLRHTGGTPLLMARVNPKVVSQMFGQASIAITLDIYSPNSPDMQQDAAATMATLLEA